MNEILVDANPKIKLHSVVKLFGAFLLARLIGVYFSILSLPSGSELMAITTYGLMISGILAFGFGLINKNKRTKSIDFWSLIFIIGFVINGLDVVFGSADSFAEMSSIIAKFMFMIGALGMTIHYFDLFKANPTKALKFPLLMGALVIILLNLTPLGLPKLLMGVTILILLLLIVSLIIIIMQWVSEASHFIKLFTSALLISFAMIFVGILAKVESLPLTVLFEIGLPLFIALMAYEMLIKDLISKK